MYVTLKLDDSGCKIHSVSNGNEEIVTNQRHVVMSWKMVTRYGTNMTLEEAVEERKKCEEDKNLVCRFEAEHRDEISEILGLIDYIDKGYVEEKFPEIYDFGPERLAIHLKDNNKKRSHTQLDSRKQVIAFQDRVITINIKEAQHPLK